MQNHLDINSLSPVIRVLSSLDTGRAPFSWEIYVLLLDREGKDGEIFLYLLYLYCFAKVAYFGVAYPGSPSAALSSSFY